MYKKIRPRNYMFWLTALFAPWQFAGTFICLIDNSLVFSRYIAKNGRLRKDIKEFRKDQIVKIGVPKDLGLKNQEPSIGRYRSQEIDFVSDSGEIIFLNARPYSKVQCRELLGLFSCEKGKQLNKILEI